VKILQEYEAEELVTLLSELRYRAEQEDDSDLVGQIDSCMGLLIDMPPAEDMDDNA
jgi:hypothetical protein